MNLTKNIIFVHGILLTERKKYQFQKNFLNILEKNDYRVYYHQTYYKFKEYKKTSTLAKEIENQIKNIDKVILIGHSYGGIILGSIDLNKYKDKIEKIILIASPINLKINFFNFVKYSKMIGYNSNNFIEDRTFSIGFLADTVVPFIFTKLPFSKHRNYFSDHVCIFFRRRRFITKILRNLDIV